MELKYENEYLDMIARKVLIAPLWNWNLEVLSAGTLVKVF